MVPNFVDTNPLWSLVEARLPVPALHVGDVSKKFGAIVALKQVSFSVAAGERVALLGPNGAGKSTLLRCICGRMKADSGTIELFGKPIGHSEAQLSFGVVPQDLAIYPDLTAKENLECFGRLHGLRGRELRDRVLWALHWSHLEDRARELTSHFSGGMKRRVNIACGIMHMPRILLLDEPTVGVDPQSRQRIFEMLDELHQGGTCIVLTTHHLEEAQQHSDRIIIVDHGEVIADGTLDELIDSTVGRYQRVWIDVEGDLVGMPEGMEWDATRQRFVCFVDNIVDMFPEIVDRITCVGGVLRDLEIQSPNLQHVFFHLTGREMRD